MAGQSRTLKLSILADVDDLKKSLNVGSKDVDGFAGKIGDFSKKAGIAFAAAAAAAGAMAIKIGIDAVKSASDLAETISKVNVLFGETAKDIEKFADGAASSLGQTKQQALDAAATFATFGKSAGLSGKDLGKFSTDFVKLSSDLASFNNTSPEQAINAIGSALRGEAEPLRQYGVLLDDASLRQAALELGIVSTTKNALTPQQKVLAAQALIYKQTSAAQGDFERTSDGLANKTRILTAQFENVKTTIGTALLPIILEIATFISNKVTPIFETLTEALSNKEGGMGGALQNIGKIFKDVVIPLTEKWVDFLFNDLWPTIFKFVAPVFEALFKGLEKISDVFTDNKEKLQPLLDLFADLWDFMKAYILPLFSTILVKAIEDAVDRIVFVVKLIMPVVQAVVAGVRILINGIIDGINLVIGAYNAINGLWGGKDADKIKKLGETGSASTTTGALGNFQLSTGSTLSTGNAGGGTGGGAGGGTGGGAGGGAGTGTTTSNTNSITGTVAKIANTTKKVVDDVAGAFDNFTSGTTSLAGIMAASNQPFAFGTSGVNTNTLAGIMAASNSPTINLTVNGAIDPEGTARTIVDTLNNSYYRGTGGATNLQIA
jgi:hypothetical protein